MNHTPKPARPTAGKRGATAAAPPSRLVDVLDETANDAIPGIGADWFLAGTARHPHGKAGGVFPRRLAGGLVGIDPQCHANQSLAVAAGQDPAGEPTSVERRQRVQKLVGMLIDTVRGTADTAMMDSRALATVSVKAEIVQCDIRQLKPCCTAAEEVLTGRGQWGRLEPLGSGVRGRTRGFDSRRLGLDASQRTEGVTTGYDMTAVEYGGPDRRRDTPERS